MTANRFIFSLGDGIDSITGSHKGRGIIMPKECKTSDISTPADNKCLEPKLVPIQSGDTQYEVVIVSDYTDLSQALDLNACITPAALGPSNLTSESLLFKKAKLSKQNVTLLIKGKKIGSVQTMPPDAKVSPECIDNLVNRRSTFVEAHGDQYVSQVMYGKIIYALINFTNTNQEEALQIKQSLEAKLTSHAKISAGPSFLKNTSTKQTLTDISLEYSGVELGLPGVASNIEDLFAFIDQFNKAELIGTPIGYVSEPYATLIHKREAAELSKQMTMVQGLLSEYNKIYNKIRILIPSIEKLVEGVQYFDLKDSDIDRLQDIQVTANKFKRIMEDLMLEISLNTTDLTCLPEKLTDTITLDIPPPLTDQDNLNDDTKSANAHQRQYMVRSQLNSILKLCTEAISNMESEVSVLSRQPIAEIVKITSDDDHVHLLELPPGGAVIRWDILNKEEKIHDGIHSFSIKVKDPKKCMSSYATIYERIASGMEKKMNITPSQRLKIATHSKDDYIIIGSVTGLQALDKSIARHHTAWREWHSAKSKEPSKKGDLIEYNGKSDYIKMSASWLEGIDTSLELHTPKL